MSASNTDEPLSNISDNSFVILGLGSMKDEHLSTQSDSNFFENSTNTSAEESTLKTQDSLTKSSISEENIQQKLNELVTENYQLKETLCQNNLAIKSQLDTFFMWQQEVLKTHESHKQKFLETKELILKLRSENAKLKSQLDDVLEKSSLKNIDDTYSQVNKPCKTETNIIQSNNLCTDFSIINESLKSENDSLKIKLSEAESKILKLNEELDNSLKENLLLKEKNEEYQKLISVRTPQPQSLPNSEARAQISNLFRQLEEEKEKVSVLKSALEKAKSSSAEETSPKLTKTDELNQCINKIDSMNYSLNDQNERFSTLQSWAFLAEENLKETKINEGMETNLMSEIKELKSHINMEENLSKEKQETLKELKKQFNGLLADYKELQAKFNLHCNNDTVIQNYKQEISSLSEKLNNKEEELSMKQQECERLREEVENLKMQCKEIEVLKIQAKIYEDDFQCERNARERLVTEKEEIAEHLRYFQNRVEELEKGESTKKFSKGSKILCPKCSFLIGEEEYEDHDNDCANMTLQF